jgi:hypothetical protein
MNRRPGSEELREGLRHQANNLRDTADEIARHWQCDDPLHPTMPVGENQPFRDWVDFATRVCQPLLEAENDAEEQAAMILYRQANPTFIATALVMALGRIDEGRAP